MKYIPIFFLFFFLFSCNSDKPEDLISKDEMTSILIEMHVAEAKVNTLNLGSDSTEVVLDLMMKKVLEDLDYSQEEYIKSYNYYLQDVRVMENLYARVVDSLSLREELHNSY
jgi:hypothetical protein